MAAKKINKLPELRLLLTGVPYVGGRDETFIYAVKPGEKLDLGKYALSTRLIWVEKGLCVHLTHPNGQNLGKPVQPDSKILVPPEYSCKLENLGEETVRVLECMSYLVPSMKKDFA